jgi:hypothetical protein
MTFTPRGLGLPPLSTVTVRLTNALGSASGNPMFAPYQMLFRTAAFSIQDSNPPSVSISSPSNSATVSANLAISGTASDNVAVQKVEVRLDGGPWLAVSGTNTWSYSMNTSNFLNGPHQVSARATDIAGNISSTNTVSVRFFNIPGAYLQRLSAGNPNNVIDCGGNTWLRDTAYSFGGFGYSGGTTGYLGNTITGICASAQSLYQRERYSTGSGGFFFQFDCPMGVYETTLLESETYWSSVGQRLFNVFIQGKQVLTNFDILQSAGGRNLPLTRIFTNAVTNSQLQVLFTPVVDNARASGVQVRKIADVFSSGDGIPDWWRLAYFGHALAQAADNSRAADDADGDGASNIGEFLAGTDPTSSASVFRITQVASAGSDVQISCSTVSNRSYQLQRRDTLSIAALWINVGSPIAGSGGILTLAHPGGATNSAEFYRVQIY